MISCIADANDLRCGGVDAVSIGSTGAFESSALYAFISISFITFGANTASILTAWFRIRVWSNVRADGVRGAVGVAVTSD